MNTPLIVIVGPTAVGKTALGIALAQAFDGEIISGDSQQIYTELAIGTAKATPKEQAQAKHHLIDRRHVWETYSVYDFVSEAKAAIEAICQKGKLPILVGGTGLYIQSLLEGYHLGGEVDQKQVLAYRSELEQLSDEVLAQKVSTAGISIKEPNRRRYIRALELAQFAVHQQNSRPDYQPLILGLTTDREQLYQRINQRVDAMMDAGLLAEARWLYDNFPDAQAARAIGYKELFPYLKGQVSLQEATDLLKRNSRRFAKRQLTWFRNRMAVDFYDIQADGWQEALFSEVSDFLLSRDS
ncbi:tRNA (adenosine(37)-N6)-dimethylallyltransferase MiaA [Streptococcus sp. DD12]|uniref:tRNA (adenosine(37)-N6)-dimethylallyltransferase MiaA n=1 Tax=Streptococcus sp. DD12 TaxID=1777880 RepID=UPI000796594C|nr:tRNA (adenosine(37)-N6)-dimethylallyltransferase MiaA [Streptococcus sp. DD12]KXT76711.1 tRNA delta(2)-isopentenylpyrophosphate transferase [Streptococcus sp. DD12]